VRKRDLARPRRRDHRARRGRRHGEAPDLERPEVGHQLAPDEGGAADRLFGAVDLAGGCERRREGHPHPRRPAPVELDEPHDVLVALLGPLEGEDADPARAEAEQGEGPAELSRMR
jgi:hypothetical protein